MESRHAPPFQYDFLLNFFRLTVDENSTPGSIERNDFSVKQSAYFIDDIGEQDLSKLAETFENTH